MTVVFSYYTRYMSIVFSDCTRYCMSIVFSYYTRYIIFNSALPLDCKAYSRGLLLTSLNLPLNLLQFKYLRHLRLLALTYQLTSNMQAWIFGI